MIGGKLLNKLSTENDMF